MDSCTGVSRIYIYYMALCVCSYRSKPLNDSRVGSQLLILYGLALSQIGVVVVNLQQGVLRCCSWTHLKGHIFRVQEVLLVGKSVNKVLFSPSPIVNSTQLTVDTKGRSTV